MLHCLAPKLTPVARLVPTLLSLILLSGHTFEGRASRPPGWNDRTHGRNAVPDYDRVFDETRVGQFDIQIAEADWQALMADMADMAGPFGGQRTPGGGGPIVSPDAAAACQGKVEGDSCSFGNPPIVGRCTQQPGAVLACFAMGGGPPGGGVPGGNVPGGPAGGRDDVELLPRTPIYVPATVTFNGTVFRHVGFRLKGNSTLTSTWRSGSEKLPFRMNFDALEDRFPTIQDQTFFGFPNLNFTNSALDSSYLRAKVVGDLFRDAGVPSASTAFVQVYLDRGTGSRYFGVYTMVEVPDKPMLDTIFGSNNGNLYKPNGTGGRWTIFIRDSFPNKTNADAEDWTDIEDAIGVLNASRQEPSVWRQRLEARFAVNPFLRWLALNTMLGNTDTYGGLSAHNYWLYGSPRHRDRLFWIPWDHDLAMSTGGFGAVGGTGGTGPQAAVDLFHDRIATNWPLIRLLLDDPVYRAAYRAQVEELLTTVFEPNSVMARFQSAFALIAPYVAAQDPTLTAGLTPAQFVQAVEGLVQYAPARHAAVRQALGAAR